jgi:hypothetical protein
VLVTRAMRRRLFLLALAVAVGCGDKDNTGSSDGPKLDWWFPDAGFESTTTLMVKADATDVTVDDAAATRDDRDVWLLTDVTPGDHTLTVDGRSETIHLAGSPMFGGALRRLARGPNGSVIGFDPGRRAVVRYRDSEHYRVVGLVDYDRALGMSVIGGNVIAAFAAASGVAIVSIDSAGKSTLLQTCAIAASNAYGFATPNGSDFYLTVPGTGIQQCSKTDSVMTPFATLAAASLLVADPDRNRFIAPAGNEVVAIAVSTGAVTPLYTSSAAIRAAVAFGPEIYALTSNAEIVHVTGPTSADLVATIANETCSEMAGCGVGELCVQCASLHVASTANGTWSVVAAPQGNAVGAGDVPDLVPPQWWTHDGFGEAIYSVSGSATQFSGTPATPVRDDGTLAIRQNGRLALVHLSDPSTIIAIPGAPITAPSVALTGSALVYAMPDGVHSRDLVSGDDTLTPQQNVLSVFADDGEQIHVVTTSTASGLTPINHTVDPRTGALVVSTDITCDIPLPLTYLSPGPLAGTVIGIAEGAENALVLADLTTQTCYVLDHVDGVPPRAAAN